MFRKIKAWWKSLSASEKKVDVSEEFSNQAPPWYRLALTELGQKEVTGSKHNPRIVEYHSKTTLKATEDEVPWCASFVCWALEMSGRPSSRSARARSYEIFGVETDTPEKGDICVFARKGGGHVGFFHSADEWNIYVLGGNQGDKVSVAPYSKARLLTIRKVPVS